MHFPPADVPLFIYADQSFALARAVALCAIQDNPDDSAPYADLAQVDYDWSLKGRAHVLDEAERYIRMAMSIQPTNPRFYSDLATYLDAQGRYTEALTVLQQASALDDTFWETHATLAKTYLGLHQYDQARAEAGAALGASVNAYPPPDPAILRQLQAIQNLQQ